MVWVPSTFVEKNRAGSRIASELCDSAAKFTIGVDPVVLDRPLGEVEVADVAVDEGRAVRDVVEVRLVARVGEGVVGDDDVVGVPLDPVADEVRADEAGAAGDEESHGRDATRGPPRHPSRDRGGARRRPSRTPCVPSSVATTRWPWSSTSSATPDDVVVVQLHARRGGRA